MQIELTFSYPEHYLPSKRHKKLRKRYHIANGEFDFRSIGIEQFPIAFITHEFTHPNNNCDDYYVSELTKTYRAFNDKLFRLLTMCSEPSHIREFMQVRVKEYVRMLDVKNQKEVSKEITAASIRTHLESYVIVDSKEIWQEVPEPTYYVQPMSTGFLHPTLLMTIQPYDDFDLENCFNALQKEEAEKHCEHLVNTMFFYAGPSSHIEVLMPEMVKCDPQAELVVAKLNTP